MFIDFMFLNSAYHTPCAYVYYLIFLFISHTMVSSNIATVQRMHIL